MQGKGEEIVEMRWQWIKVIPICMLILGAPLFGEWLFETGPTLFKVYMLLFYVIGFFGGSLLMWHYFIFDVGRK